MKFKKIESSLVLLLKRGVLKKYGGFKIKRKRGFKRKKNFHDVEQ